MGDAVPAKAAGPGVTTPADASVPPTTEHPTTRSRPSWLVPTLGAVGLVIVVVVAWMLFAGRRGNAAYDQGVQAYREGRREAAEGDFRKAASDDPADPIPHVYLARMERDRGNLNNANAEAVKAVQLGPNNGAALRELASVLFGFQNYAAARSFYLTAIRPARPCRP